MVRPIPVSITHSQRHVIKESNQSDRQKDSLRSHIQSLEAICPSAPKTSALNPAIDRSERCSSRNRARCCPFSAAREKRPGCRIRGAFLPRRCLETLYCESSRASARSFTPRASASSALTMRIRLRSARALRISVQSVFGMRAVCSKLGLFSMKKCAAVSIRFHPPAAAPGQRIFMGVLLPHFIRRAFVPLPSVANIQHHEPHQSFLRP